MRLKTFLARLYISFFALILIIGLVFLALRFKYSRPVIFEDHWMDSPLTIDQALTSGNALLSSRIPEPTMIQIEQPVCLLVHGFSASSAEFDNFKELLDKQGTNLLISTVVMGGHGQNYAVFKDATYKDWIQPIIDEVSKLKRIGYKNISIFAVSGGGAATLHAVLSEKITGIRQLILLDPYIVPKNKLIFWVPVLRTFIKNTTSAASRDVEYMNKYVNRPASALDELRQLVLQVQHDLKTNQLDEVPSISVFTASGDPSSDTIGADYIKRYIPSTSVIRYESDQHVIIDSKTKINWTDDDQKLMLDVVTQILSLF